jgi:hypothetical protein
MSANHRLKGRSKTGWFVPFANPSITNAFVEIERFVVFDCNIFCVPELFPSVVGNLLVNVAATQASESHL